MLEEESGVVPLLRDSILDLAVRLVQRIPGSSTMASTEQVNLWVSKSCEAIASRVEGEVHAGLGEDERLLAFNRVGELLLDFKVYKTLVSIDC